MKKIIAMILVVFGGFIALFSSACNIGGQFLDGLKGQSSKDLCEIYLDTPNKELDGIAVRFSCSENMTSLNSENQRLTVYFNCTNVNVDKKTITVSNAKILYEETGVTYDVSVSPQKSIDLQYGIEHTFTFSATIPKSYKKTNYVLSFSADRDYKIYLYETPDELRKNCTVSFVVDNNVVQEVQVKEGRCLAKIYAWETDDYLYHCNKWYTDKSYQNKFTSNKKIEKNTILYGRKSSNIEMTYDKGYYVTGINYVHSSGILVIPEKGESNIYISNFAIHRNSEVKEIYFPRTLKKIYAGNFKDMPNLKKIHFAGSQDEWDLVEISYSTSIPEKVAVVYDSDYS